MKHLYFQSLTGLLLILGLCSCKPDKTTAETMTTKDAFEVKSVDYIHIDNSLHNINDTKELAIDSSIQLNIQSDKAESFTLDAQSTCSGASLASTVYHSQYWKDQTSISVKELLPIEIYKPFANDNIQIICDFKLEIKNALGSKTTIDLEDIKITKLFNYYTMNAFKNNSSEAAHYILDNQINRIMDFPFKNGKAHLICDDNLRTITVETQTFPISTIKNQQFLNHHVNFCRFVFEDRESRQRMIGRNFYLQKEKTKIQFELQTHFPEAIYESGLINISFNLNTIVSLKIHNIGNTTTYIDLNSAGNSEFEFLGYYSSGKQAEHGFHRDAIVHGFHWSTQDQKIVQKDNGYYIELPPHASTTLHGKTTGRIQCGRGFPGAITNHGDCFSQSIFHGYLVNLHGLPNIRFSQGSNINNTQWDSFPVSNILHPAQNLGAWIFRYWKGSPHIPNHCQQNLQRNAQFPTALQSVSNIGNSNHSCQLF